MMPIVAERNWVAIRRDRRIHTRPLEVRVFSEVGLRTVWLGGKKDMGSRQQLARLTGWTFRWKFPRADRSARPAPAPAHGQRQKRTSRPPTQPA